MMILQLTNFIQNDEEFMTNGQQREEAGYYEDEENFPAEEYEPTDEEMMRSNIYRTLYDPDDWL